MFKAVEHVFVFSSKVEGNVILSQINKRFYYNTIVVNKASIEVVKTKEGLYPFNYSQVRLFTNNRDFLRIDLKTKGRYNKT